MLDRRSFLRSLATVVGVAATDPEKLLWVPGERTIFLPPAQNQFVTIEMITQEALRVLKSNLVFTRYINSVYERDQFDVGRKIGSTITIRRPPTF